MEYKHFLPLLAQHLPDGVLNDTQQFKDFLMNNGSSLIYELADFMLITLPNPRVTYYQSSDFV